MRHARTFGFLAAILTTMSATTAGAVLAPQYQRLEELYAVIESASNVFNTTPIDAVERVAPDEYEVRAGSCVLTVRIVDVPTKPEVIGPRQFEAEPGEPECE